MWKQKSVPPTDTLATAAPLLVWEHAMRQAIRSPMIKFKVGAVIYNPATRKIVSRGCAHPDVRYSRLHASCHAEKHALRFTNRELEGHWCVLFTYNCRGGSAWTSRPCFSCATALYGSDVERVIYPERVGERKWVVRIEHPEELLLRAPQPTGAFARHQRIPMKLPLQSLEQ